MLIFEFYLLSLLTIHLYFVYWVYRNWRMIKERTGESLWPPVRGFFYIFFTHSLLTDVDEHLRTRNKEFNWNPMATATIFIIAVLVINVSSQMSARGVGLPATDLIWIALVPVTPVFLFPAQRAINAASDDPDGNTNSGLTLANWVWMVIGGLLLATIAVDIYILNFAPEMYAP